MTFVARFKPSYYNGTDGLFDKFWVDTISVSSDIETTGWTGTPSSNLYSNIDETIRDDSDYITSPDLSAATPVTFGLPRALDAGEYGISVRGKYSNSPGQIRISMLNDSDISQGNSAWVPLSNTIATYSLPVITTGIATRIKIEVQ